MTKINQSSIQSRIISQMDRYCREYRWTAHKAAVYISKGSRSSGSIQSISHCTVKRWYSLWLDTLQLPSKTSPKFKLRSAAIWNAEILSKLKEIVDTCPVLYLDEISEKLEQIYKRANI